MSVWSRPTIEVRVYGQNGQPNTVIDGFKYLQISQELNKPGYFQMIFDVGCRDYLPDFELDGLIEFWRKDIPNGLQSYREAAMLFRTSVQAQFSSGIVQHSVFGGGVLDLLERRIIAVRAESNSANLATVGSVVSLPASDAIQRYIEQHAGASATVGNGRLLGGVTPGLTTSLPNGSTVLVWDGDMAYKNLLATVKDISQWSYTGAGPIVDVRAEVVAPNVYNIAILTGGEGTDRTIGNGAVVPIVFSTRLGDVSNIWLSRSRSDEINTVFATGSGVGGGRAVGLAVDAAAVADSPFNQIEGTVTVGTSVNTDEQNVAEQELENTRFSPRVSLIPSATCSVVYGRDYFLGDTVSVLHEGARIDVRILKVDLSISDTGKEQIKLEVSEESSPFNASYLLFEEDSGEGGGVATKADTAALRRDIERLRQNQANDNIF